MAISARMCMNAKFVGQSSDTQTFIPVDVKSAVLRMAPAASSNETQSKENSDDRLRSRYVRWATLTAAAAVSISVLSASPSVLAGEWEFRNDMITHSITGDHSLNIAIPIPDSNTWANSQEGFLAPPPGRGGEISVLSNYQGGCPAWQPSQFEMIVPDGVHPKYYPRHGRQWPALYMLEEATIDHPAFNSNDPGVKYASLIEALMRMSDAGLSCFSL